MTQNTVCRVILPHSTPTAILASADIIIITFEFQKNDWRNHTVHMFCTNDPLLCPVKAGAVIVRRILSTVPNSSPDTKLCSFCASDNQLCASSSMAPSDRRAHRGIYPRLQQRRHRATFNPLRRSHGHVPGRDIYSDPSSHRPVEQQSIPGIHQRAGGIFHLWRSSTHALPQAFLHSQSCRRTD